MICLKLIDIYLRVPQIQRKSRTSHLFSFTDTAIVLVSGPDHGVSFQP